MIEMGRVSGKVALISGGASGLGRAAAQILAEHGARVVITDVQVDAGTRVAVDIGRDVLFLRQDVSKEEDWQRVMSQILEEYGQLDVLVNNAALLHMASIEDTSLEDWRRIHAVNSDGVFLGCKYAVETMKGTTQGGSIINISSGAGLRPISLVPAYGASKSVVWSLTRTTALHCAESGYPIRCNSIHPGVIRTPMMENTVPEGEDIDAVMAMHAEVHPMKRLVTVEDVALSILYLASDESAIVTGVALPVDGGYNID
jgi:NAD(P)-dependent dehydrogenase (short-subunit alcohol dehydrogenase family)